MLIADLFFDEKYREPLYNNGFVIIPLLKEGEVEQLNSLYINLAESAGIEKEFYTSIWSDNMAHRKEVNEGVKAILLPALQKYFRAIQPVFANFMVKGTGENSSLLTHQDWSFVKEPEFDSVTVWVPLSDVNHDNGNLQVVPRSHLTLQNFIRPRFGDAAFSREKAIPQLVDIPMKAGEALILNSRLIHASPPNFSGRERISASIVLAPAEAQLKHWLTTKNGVEEFDIDQTFFWKHSCYDRLESLLHS